MKKNKIFVLVTTCVLVAASVGSSSAYGKEATFVLTEQQVAVNKQLFIDVTPKNVNYAVIQDMATKGIIKGYADGTFKPNEKINRKQASVLIHRLGKLPKTKTSKAIPKDLSASNTGFDAIMALYNHDLLAVDGKGNINPNKELTRGEMAKILATVFGLKGKTHQLTDVSDGVSAYVSALYQNDVTTGFEDGTFREKTSLTRAHYAVFMYRAMTATGELNVETPKNQQVKPSAPVQTTETISMNNTAKEIEKYLEKSGLYSKDVQMIYFDDAMFKNAPVLKSQLVNMEKMLENTNFGIYEITGGAIDLKEPNWKNDHNLMLYTQFSVSNEGTYTLDYSRDSTLEIAKRFIEHDYKGQLDMEKTIAYVEKKFHLAQDNLSDKLYTSFYDDTLETNGYVVRVGTYMVDSYRCFRVDISKK